jgi:hypothetical protein
VQLAAWPFSRHYPAVREQLFLMAFVRMTSITGCGKLFAKNTAGRAFHLRLMAGVTSNASHQPRVDALLTMQRFLVALVAGCAKRVKSLDGGFGGGI